jgi:hypothetical protein
MQIKLMTNELTVRGFLIKTTIAYHVKELPTSTEPEVHSRAHHAITAPFLNNLNSADAYNNTCHFSLTRFNIIPSPTPRCPQRSLYSDFLTKILYAFLIFLTHISSSSSTSWEKQSGLLGSVTYSNITSRVVTTLRAQPQHGESVHSLFG